MSAQYSSTSPWFLTPIVNNYLDVLTPRPIEKSNEDFPYVIEPQYNRRPDLLAYDMYGNAKLWWVFAQRNPDKIQDPIFDFIAGVEIFLPRKNTLLQNLGL